MSRREYKTINRRQQRGRKDAVREGKFPANKAPYGYVRVKLEKETGYTLEPHPDQAPIVQMIYDLYVNHNMGSGLIANHLAGLGVPTALNNVWEVQTVIGIIRNPIYYGLVTWGRRAQTKQRSKGIVSKSRPRAAQESWVTGKGLHEPLVSKKLWDLAQEILASNYHVPAPRGVVTSALAGIVKCEMCGKAMVRRPYTSSQPPSLICTTRGCKHISSAFDMIESRIIDGLRSWISDYKAKWEIEKDGDKERGQNMIYVKETIVRSAMSNIEKLKAQADNLDDLLEQGLYSKSKYIELVGRIKEAETAHQMTNRELATEMNRERAKIDIIPRVEHVMDVYPHTDDVGLRNELLKSVIEVCIYKKTVRGHWSRPDTLEMFDVTIHPRLPKHLI